jgi:hypothetical protein
MRTRTLAVAAATALATGVLVTPAQAAETESSVLRCGKKMTVSVTGFGRGQVLHVVDSNTDFIVTTAILTESGVTVFDIPGQDSDADIVTCTTTSPSGTRYTLKGFFTPA